MSAGYLSKGLLGCRSELPGVYYWSFPVGEECKAEALERSSIAVAFKRREKRMAPSPVA